MKIFYCFENGHYMTEKQLFDHMKTFYPEETDFNKFLSDCMFENNGSLITLAQKKEELEEEKQSIIFTEWYDVSEIVGYDKEIEMIENMKKFQAEENKMKIFYDVENGNYVSENAFKRFIKEAYPEENDFPRFLSECLSGKNHCLMTLQERKKQLERDREEAEKAKDEKDLQAIYTELFFVDEMMQF